MTDDWQSLDGVGRHTPVLIRKFENTSTGEQVFGYWPPVTSILRARKQPTSAPSTTISWQARLKVTDRKPHC
eukprot:scaffold217224_cov36-Prasinocladus_malaysianus.AAC.1